MGIKYNGIDAAVNPTGATSDLTANTSDLFTFSNPVKRAIVQNDPDSGVKLFVKWNKAPATLTGIGGWDVVLSPGDMAVAPDGIMVKTVSLISPGNMTNGTNFVILGWE